MRALLVSYAFPPVGGAGVQRSVKLAKYLPYHGVTPTVLSVSNPSVPLLDYTFEKDFPPGMRVVRARTLEPGYAAKQVTWQAAADQAPSLRRQLLTRGVSFAKQLLVPDPQLLWLPGAARALVSELGHSAPDVVFVTAPPFSQFLLGPLLRLARGTALVFDYRDEWSTARSTYEMLQGGVAGAVGERMERALIYSAHYITTATEEFRENLLERFPRLDPARVVAIPNGYDPDDYPAVLPEPPEALLTLGYAGTLFKLTSAQGLLAAVRLVHQREPALAKRLRLRFMGRIVDTELGFFEGTEQLGVERVGYVPHDQVLAELGRCHVTLCLLDEVPGVERIYPAKLFELMHLGRPMLTLAPPGALTRLVQQHGLGEVRGPRDVEGIAALLELWLREFAAGRAPEMNPDRDAIRGYHRRALAGRFAEVMRGAVDYARAGARSERPSGSNGVSSN